MAVIPDKLITDIIEFLKDQDLNEKYVNDWDRYLVSNFIYAIDLTVKYENNHKDKK